MIEFESYKMGNDDEIVVIALSGRIDQAASEYFLDCVRGQIEDGDRKLVLDCRNVEFISSLGLGSLVRAHSRMKHVGGNVKLARINALLTDVLRTVGLNKLFHIYPTVREACASFDS